MQVVILVLRRQIQAVLILGVAIQEAVARLVIGR
jgi:hypothetical protein